MPVPVLVLLVQVQVQAQAQEVQVVRRAFIVPTAHGATSNILSMIREARHLCIHRVSSTVGS